MTVIAAPLLGPLPTPALQVPAAAPWFRRSPRVAIVLAVGLFMAVLSLRLFEASPEVPVGLLYCLPIALLAVAFGLRAGLLAGAAGVAFITTWALAAGADYSALSWAARTVPLVLLGGLLGDATDRLVRSEAEGRRASAAAARTRDAVERG